MSQIRAAFLDFDLSAALWRVAITQDNDEIRDLLPEQIDVFRQKFPAGTAQREALDRLYEAKTKEHGHG